MDLDAKLQTEIDAHAALLQREQALEAELYKVRDQRACAIGRVQAIHELVNEQAAEDIEEVQPENNGHSTKATVELVAAQE